MSVHLYMKEFNNSVLSYQKRRPDDSEKLLNRNLSVISGVENLDLFKPDNTESCQFYINLYDVLKRANPKSDLCWSSLAVLEKASRNLEARNALLQQFRFIPLLSKLLEDVSGQDKVMKILTIIQDLSYGIKITWQEPYLEGLIQKLVEHIYGDESSVGSLALSVLINICYKNFPSIYLLLRTVHATTFAKKIKSYGILTSKMLIILDNNIDSPNVTDLHNFIKKSFLEIEDCMQTWNVPYLKHIVEFITDARNNEGMQYAFREYTDFNNDIDQLLKRIDNAMDVDGISIEGGGGNNNESQCFALLFDLLDYILKIDQNLSPILPKIFNLASKWLNSTHASSKALDLIRTIIINADETYQLNIIKEIEQFLPEMLCKSEVNTISIEQIIALLKVLIAMLKYSITQTIVLSTVKESYFDKMFSHLISTKPNSLNYAKFSNEDTTKYLLCLQILIEFANIAPTVWHCNVRKLFQLKQIHFIIAKGILSEKEDLVRIVLDMAQTDSFPTEDVAKITSKLSPLISSKDCNQYQFEQGFRTSNEVIEHGEVGVNKNLEERLNTLISHIFEAQTNSEIVNVATSELIELFHYKINLCNTTEKNLVKRLEDASEEITNLSHRISLLSHEMSQYYSINFKLHLTQERLQSENMDNQRQIDTLKETTGELMNKIDNERKKYQSYSKSLEIKKAEAENLKTELDKYQKREVLHIAEIKQLTATNKETTTRIEQYKKKIHLCEESFKEKQKALEEKEKEFTKALKTIEELRECNIKSENIIKHLEKQLAEKNEAIRTYELELKETEEMRRTVLSLMESKKPKRKN